MSINPENFAERLKQKRPGLTLLEFNGYNESATVICQQGHEWTVPCASKLLRIKNVENECPYCSGYYKDLTKEAIGVIRPDLVQYFKNKEDAFKYTKYSDKVVEQVCPICGSEKTGTVSTLYSNGFSCPVCKDGISMPNKMIREVIKQCKDQVDFYKFEYGPDWLNGKSYDAYFEIGNLKVAIEMQGPQHFGAIGIYPESTYLSYVKRDEEKRIASKENGVVEIEILSLISDLEYQKEEILKSELCKYLDLSIVDWDKIFYDVSNPIIDKVVKLYEQGLGTFQIHEQIDICQKTVTKYLKIATELGLTNYRKRKKITDK